MQTQVISRSSNPDRMVCYIKDLDVHTAKAMAEGAVYLARRIMPKVSGAGARGLKPMYGKGYFGIGWADKYVWFNENGINPFTMKSLAGKLIPMWIEDPTGAERLKSPKAKTRTTVDGRVQVLIFRRAAKIGEGKTSKTSKKGKGSKVTGKYESTAKHPGQAGRIAKREAPAPYTTPGKRPGAIAKGNVGVWWRHPGITPRNFLNYAITTTAEQFGHPVDKIVAADAGNRF